MTKTKIPFEEIVESQNADECLEHFGKARTLYEQKENRAAIIEINKAIDSFNKLDESITLCFYHPDSTNESLLYPNNTKHLAYSLHFLAAELYAVNDEPELSLMHYQAYHYYCSQTSVPDEMKEKDSVVLYSYRKFGEYVLGDIINNQITLCHPSMMNDPFDSIANLWTKEENLRLRCKEKKHIEPYSKSFNYFRIRSFVADRKSYESNDTLLKNILMWSHYANQHEGICIKYRLSKYFIKSMEKIEDSSFFKLLSIKPIEYVPDFPIDENQKSIDTNLAYFKKYECWGYESEVRLLCYDTSTDSKVITIPLDEDSHIEEIVFGYRCSDMTKRTIHNLFMGIPDYKDVELSQMVQDIRNGVYNLTKIKAPNQ